MRGGQRGRGRSGRRREAAHHALRGHVVVVRGRVRVAVLGLVELFAHHVVQGATAEVEDLLEGPPEVAVQRGVDDRVEQRVSVAQPLEQGQHGLRNAVRVPGDSYTRYLVHLFIPNTRIEISVSL